MLLKKGTNHDKNLKYCVLIIDRLGTGHSKIESWISMVKFTACNKCKNLDTFYILVLVGPVVHSLLRESGFTA